MYETKDSIRQIKQRPGLDLFQILTASPYDYKSNLDKKFTEDLFYKHIFVRPDKYQSMKDHLVKVLKNYETKREIFLTGFAGCGKTTFIKWFINDIKTDKKHEKFHFYYIDIFSSQEPENIDIVEDNYQKAEKEFRRINLSIDELFYDIFILDNLSDDEKNKKLDMFTSPQISIFDFLVNSFIYINTVNSDITDRISCLRDICITESKKNKKVQIKGIKFSYEEKYLILMLFFMYSMFFNESYDDIFIIIFDNLDALKVQYYNDSVVEFIEKCNENLQKIINIPELFGFDCNINFNYSFKSVYCIREANYEKISGHLKERKTLENIGFTIEFLFINEGKECYAEFFREWVIKRINFANNELCIACNENFTHFIDIITSDLYVYTLGRIFNYNFRSLISFFKFLKQYTEENNPHLADIINQFNNYKNQPDNIRQGFKGMIFSILIVYLFKNYNLGVLLATFDDGIKSFDENNDFKTLNIFRTLLTLILNWSFDKMPYNLEEFKREKNYMSFSRLKREVNTLFQDKHIVKCLRRFSYLHDEDYYFNPVSFVNIDILRERDEDILNYLDGGSRENLRTFTSLEPPKLSINPSGFAYLKNIIPHFEWFSVRHSMQNSTCVSPLFYEPLKKDYDNKYCYEIIIENVFVQVNKCIRTIKSFYDEKFINNKKCENYFEFINSKFCFRHFGELDEDDIPRKYGKTYPIRIIDYHTSYLESFRIYLMNLIHNDSHYNEAEKLKQKQQHNKKMIEYIEQYIDLYFVTYFHMNIDNLKNEYRGETIDSIKLKYLGRESFRNKNAYPSEYVYYIEDYKRIMRIREQNYAYDMNKPILLRGF